MPESVTGLPDFEPRHGLEASLLDWEYGEVAESLHVGPDDQEAPTVERWRARRRNRRGP